MTSITVKTFTLCLFVLTALIIPPFACASPSTQTSNENSQPVIRQIMGMTDWSPSTEGQFSCLASDPDGDNLTYQWSADNGTISGDGEKISWASPARMGDYKITVTVRDGRGGETTMDKEIRVLINEDGSVTPDAPVVLELSFTSPEPATASKRIRIWTSSFVECKIEGTDPADLKYSWTPSNGKLQAKGLAEGKASLVTWIAPGVAGDFTLDVIATNGNGEEAKGTVNFKVYCCGN